MEYKTFEQIDEEIREDLDLIDEPIISQTQMIKIVNKAIKKAEAIIHTLYEDYFFTWEYISLVGGVSEYDLPADIYGMKLRGLIYSSGTKRYRVDRLRGKYLLEKITDFENEPSADYQYVLKNPAGGNPQLVLFPAGKATESTALRAYYIREANQIVETTDLCDIPEFATFIVAEAKYKAALKAGHPELSELKEARDQEQQLMIDTLQAPVVDEDNLAEMDLSIYEEHS